jgi:D-ribose pyranase
MKKVGILNKQLSDVIAGLGQSDMIVICDAGLPVPDECIRIDLALVEGEPRFMTVLDAVLQELAVESVILAEECKEENPVFHECFLSKVDPLRPRYVTHEEFKKMCKDVKAVIRTGECTSYANSALVCGNEFLAGKGGE